MCWKGAPERFEDLGAIFPPAAMRFAGNVTLALLPHRYLFAMGGGQYCLGVFDNGAEGTIIGGIAVRNALVLVGGRAKRSCGPTVRTMGSGVRFKGLRCACLTLPPSLAVELHVKTKRAPNRDASPSPQYDLERQRVGFAEADCPNLGSAVDAAAAAAAKRVSSGRRGGAFRRPHNAHVLLRGCRARAAYCRAAARQRRKQVDQPCAVPGLLPLQAPPPSPPSTSAEPQPSSAAPPPPEPSASTQGAGGATAAAGGMAAEAGPEDGSSGGGGSGAAAAGRGASALAPGDGGTSSGGGGSGGGDSERAIKEGASAADDGGTITVVGTGAGGGAGSGTWAPAVAGAVGLAAGLLVGYAAMSHRQALSSAWERVAGARARRGAGEGDVEQELTPLSLGARSSNADGDGDEDGGRGGAAAIAAGRGVRSAKYGAGKQAAPAAGAIGASRDSLAASSRGSR